jgi:tetratricopeptide (TPR) repeat protein
MVQGSGWHICRKVAGIGALAVLMSSCTHRVKSEISVALQDREAGYRALLHDQYDDAERHYLTALKKLEQANDILGIAFTASELAHVYEGRDDFSKAAAAYERSVSSREKTLQQTDSPNSRGNVQFIVNAMLSQAQAYEKCGRNNLAKKTLENALRLCKQSNVLEQLEDIQLQLTLLKNQSDPNSSADASRLRLFASAFDGPNKDRAESFRRSRISARKGDVEQARSTLLGALAMCGPSSNHGDARGKQSESSAKLQQQLDLLHRATCLAELADLDQSAGSLESARKYQEECFQIRKRVLWEEHPDLLSARLAFARILARSGQWDEATKLLLEQFQQHGALSTDWESLKNDLVNGQTHLAEEKYGEHNLDSAEQHSKLALRLASMKPVSKKYLFDAYDTAGNILFYRTQDRVSKDSKATAAELKKDYGEVEQFYLTAAKLLPFVDKDQREELKAQSLLKLATTHCGLGRFARAEEEFNAAAKQYRLIGDAKNAADCLAKAAFAAKNAVPTTVPEGGSR